MPRTRGPSPHDAPFPRWAAQAAGARVLGRRAAGPPPCSERLLRAERPAAATEAAAAAATDATSAAADADIDTAEDISEGDSDGVSGHDGGHPWGRTGCAAPAAPGRRVRAAAQAGEFFKAGVELCMPPVHANCGI